MPPVTAAAPVPALPPSRDVAYPGTMALTVDASDTVGRAFRTVQTIPVERGAREIVLVDSGGICSPDIHKLKFTKLRRPIWPFDGVNDPYAGQRT